MVFKALIVAAVAAALSGAVVASPVTTVPSPQSLRSDITIVVDNDLEGASSPNAKFGFIYLSEKHSYPNAVSACRALGETLWSPWEGEGLHVESALEFLKDEVESLGAWVGEKGGKPYRLLGSGSLGVWGESFELPVLCTQSAPYSNSSYQDKDERWQVEVSANNEKLVGFRDHLSFRFFGIRYALQPKRFTYSTLYGGSGTTTSALNYGSECVQGTTGSEDCLFLNVWTPYLPASPATSSSKLKPVLFWIHGGAFTSGTGSDPTFDGGNLASRGDVVIVTINYRLSTLGFLALNDGVTNGNFGFADQIVALDWVRENIRSFGGDPDRITVFGQSAGAGSVRAMMASPVALGKFAGAVPMSNLGGLAYGTTYSKYYTIPEEVSVAADAILNATGCTHVPSQVNCLREVDPFTLVNLPTVARFMVVDGTYLTTTQLPLQGNHGKTAPYKLMMGLAADDGTPFITYPPDVTAQNTEWLTSQGLPYPPRSLFPLEPLQNQTLAVDRMGARLATDAIFRCIDQATVHAGLINKIWDRVFFYELERTYQTPGWPDLDLCVPPVEPGYPYGDPEAKIGYDKCHSGDLLYVFGNIRWNGLPYRDAQGDADFEREMLDRWAAFATTGDPNLNGAHAGEGVRWTAATSGDNVLMQLNWPGEKMAAFDELPQCAWLGLPIDYYLTK